MKTIAILVLLAELVFAINFIVLSMLDLGDDPSPAQKNFLTHNLLVIMLIMGITGLVFTLILKLL